MTIELKNKNSTKIKIPGLILKILDKEELTRDEINAKLIGSYHEIVCYPDPGDELKQSVNKAFCRLLKTGKIKEIKDDETFISRFISNSFYDKKFYAKGINYSDFIKQIKNKTFDINNASIINNFSLFSIYLINNDPYQLNCEIPFKVDSKKYISDCIEYQFGVNKNDSDFEFCEQIYFRRRFLDKLIKMQSKDFSLDFYIYKYSNPFVAKKLYDFLINLEPEIDFKDITFKNENELNYDIKTYVFLSTYSDVDDYFDGIDNDYDPNNIDYGSKDYLKILHRYSELWDAHNCSVRKFTQISFIRNGNFVIIIYNLSKQLENLAQFTDFFAREFNIFLDKGRKLAKT